MSKDDDNDTESFDELHLSQMINFADETEKSQNTKVNVSDNAVESLDEAEASALVEALDEVERNESQSINQLGINVASQTPSEFYYPFLNKNIVNEAQLCDYLTDEVVKRLDRVFGEPTLTFSRIQLEGVVENAMNRVRTECRHMIDDIITNRLAQLMERLSRENSEDELESDDEYFPSEDLEGPSTSTPKLQHVGGKKNRSKQLRGTEIMKRKNTRKIDDGSSESDSSTCSESATGSSIMLNRKNRKRSVKKTSTGKKSLKKSRLVISSTESESVVTSSTDIDENVERSPDEVYNTDDFIDDDEAEEIALSSRRKLRSPRRQRFTCDICSELFCDERLFALHKKRHAKGYTR